MIPLVRAIRPRVGRAAFASLAAGDDGILNATYLSVYADLCPKLVLSALASLMCNCSLEAGSRRSGAQNGGVAHHK